MTTAEGFAPAKVNLTLHVTGLRTDGYHELDSCVVFANVGDRLEYAPGQKTRIELSGPFSAGVPADKSNLVWKAAELSGWTGRIALQKNLPHGAGIGGGSSDAAAVLRDLAGPVDRALELGADVPVCLSQTPQRMRGIGELLDPIERFPALDMVLINPGGHVSTPQVFKGLRTKNNRDMGVLPAFTDRSAALYWLAEQRNDLQGPALAQAPQISEALSCLGGAELARMSGSGATCFGIYPDLNLAKTAADEIATARPDWWVRACSTFGA